MLVSQKPCVSSDWTDYFSALAAADSEDFFLLGTKEKAIYCLHIQGFAFYLFPSFANPTTSNALKKRCSCQCQFYDS